MALPFDRTKVFNGTSYTYVPGISREIALAVLTNDQKEANKHIRCIVTNRIPTQQLDELDIDEYNEEQKYIFSVYLKLPAYSGVHEGSVVIIGAGSKVPVWTYVHFEFSNTVAEKRNVPPARSLDELIRGRYDIPSDVKIFGLSAEYIVMNHNIKPAILADWIDGFPVVSNANALKLAVNKHAVVLAPSIGIKRPVGKQIPSQGLDFDVFFNNPYIPFSQSPTDSKKFTVTPKCHLVARFLPSCFAWAVWNIALDELATWQLFSSISTVMALVSDQCLRVDPYTAMPTSSSELDFTKSRDKLPKFHDIFLNKSDSVRADYEGLYVVYQDEKTNKRFVEIYGKKINDNGEGEHTLTLELMQTEVMVGEFGAFKGWRIKGNSRTYPELVDAVQCHFWRTNNVRPFFRDTHKPTIFRPRQLLFGGQGKSLFRTQFVTPNIQKTSSAMETSKELIPLFTRNNTLIDLANVIVIKRDETVAVIKPGLSPKFKREHKDMEIVVDELEDEDEEWLSDDDESVPLPPDVLPYTTGFQRHFYMLNAWIYINGDYECLEIKLDSSFGSSVQLPTTRFEHSVSAVARAPLQCRKAMESGEPDKHWLTFSYTDNLENLLKAYVSVISRSRQTALRDVLKV